MTAGGLDTHVHFICPQLVPEALASGVTTLYGGGTGPNHGTLATTITPAPSQVRLPRPAHPHPLPPIPFPPISFPHTLPPLPFPHTLPPSPLQSLTPLSLLTPLTRTSPPRPLANLGLYLGLYFGLYLGLADPNDAAGN